MRKSELSTIIKINLRDYDGNFLLFCTSQIGVKIRKF